MDDISNPGYSNGRGYCIKCAKFYASNLLTPLKRGFACPDGHRVKEVNEKNPTPRMKRYLKQTSKQKRDS